MLRYWLPGVTLCWYRCWCIRYTFDTVSRYNSITVHSWKQIMSPSLSYFYNWESRFTRILDAHSVWSCDTHVMSSTYSSSTSTFFSAFANYNFYHFYYFIAYKDRIVNYNHERNINTKFSDKLCDLILYSCYDSFFESLELVFLSVRTEILILTIYILFESTTAGRGMYTAYYSSKWENKSQFGQSAFSALAWSALICALSTGCIAHDFTNYHTTSKLINKEKYFRKRRVEYRIIERITRRQCDWLRRGNIASRESIEMRDRLDRLGARLNLRLNYTAWLLCRVLPPGSK